MKLEIIKKERNALLSREEVAAKITFDGKTPSREEVLKALVDNLNLDSERLALKLIKTIFGARSADVMAYVYDSKEKKAELEPKKKEVNKKVAKEEKK